MKKTNLDVTGNNKKESANSCASSSKTDANNLPFVNIEDDTTTSGAKKGGAKEDVTDKETSSKAAVFNLKAAEAEMIALCNELSRSVFQAALKDSNFVTFAAAAARSAFEVKRAKLAEEIKVKLGGVKNAEVFKLNFLTAHFDAKETLEERKRLNAAYSSRVQTSVNSSMKVVTEERAEEIANNKVAEALRLEREKQRKEKLELARVQVDTIKKLGLPKEAEKSMIAKVLESMNIPSGLKF